MKIENYYTGRIGQILSTKHIAASSNKDGSESNSNSLYPIIV